MKTFLVWKSKILYIQYCLEGWHGYMNILGRLFFLIITTENMSFTGCNCLFWLIGPGSVTFFPLVCHQHQVKDTLLWMPGDEGQNKFKIFSSSNTHFFLLNLLWLKHYMWQVSSVDVVWEFWTQQGNNSSSQRGGGGGLDYWGQKGAASASMLHCHLYVKWTPVASGV